MLYIQIHKGGKTNSVVPTVREGGGFKFRKGLVSWFPVSNVLVKKITLFVSLEKRLNLHRWPSLGLLFFAL